MDIHNSILDFVGNTPLLELKNIFTPSRNKILAKMENFNPTSIKDRAVRTMIQKAMEAGRITKNTEVVEASSGNTAISIASLGVVFGYKTRIFMSDLCSEERIKILNAYGAKVVLTPGIEHTKGARERAEAYCKANPGKAFFLNQHSNENNGMAHFLTTGPEIWEQTDGRVDAVIMGLGTSGTFDGLSRFLKGKNPNIRIIGFEPEESPVYSGGAQGKHKIIGIGPGFVTDNFIRSQHNLDELLLVSDNTAFEWTRKIAQTEGILVGPTSGAGAYVAEKLAQRADYTNKIIVFIICDTGERYLSTENLFEINDVERIP
jgi:cysteine synthase A